MTTLASYLANAPQNITPADWQAAIAENLAAAQAILDVAKFEGRSDATDGEVAEFEQLLDEIKDGKQRLQAAEDAKTKRLERAQLAIATGQAKTSIFPGYSQEPARMDQVHHRIGPLKCFKGSDAVKDAYSAGQWLKAVTAKSLGRHDDAAESYLRSVGLDILAVGTEGIPSGGGYLVPTPMSNAIVDVRALAGVSRQLARVYPMTSETQTVPKKASGTTVYYPGEGGAITPSDQSWGQVQLTAKKRAILSKVSMELRDDAVINIVDDLASQMGTDFAVKEDAELVLGDGTSTYGG